MRQIPSVHSRRAKLAVELFGTFALVLVSAGTARFGLLPAALAYGVTFGVLVAFLGQASGGHFNPAVTIGYWVTHRLGTFEAVGYCAAQLVGAAGAAYLLRLVSPAADLPPAVVLGVPGVAPGLTRAPAMLIEGAMTFCLVLALFVTTVDKARIHYWLAGLAAAAVIVVASLAGGALTGAVMNPARAFGPALAARYWAHQGVYWVGPLAGAVAAASLYDLLFRRTIPSAPAAPQPGRIG